VKAIILGAGYGTRLERDIRENTSRGYEHLAGVPKPLLPIADKPLINYLLDEINKCKMVDGVYVVTNNLHYGQFERWAEKYGFPLGNIVNDGTTINEERLGAIADIALVVREKEIDEEVLIVAGDTLFDPRNFPLEKILNYFYEKGESLLTRYKLGSEEEISRRGILELSEEGKVTAFLEKPSPAETDSRWACPPFYVYSGETLGLLEGFLEQTSCLKERDAPGRLVAWLCKRVSIYAPFEVSRFDVGGLEDYKETDKFFRGLHR